MNKKLIWIPVLIVVAVLAVLFFTSATDDEQVVSTDSTEITSADDNKKVQPKDTVEIFVTNKVVAVPSYVPPVPEKTVENKPVVTTSAVVNESSPIITAVSPTTTEQYVKNNYKIIITGSGFSTSKGTRAANTVTLRRVDGSGAVIIYEVYADANGTSIELVPTNTIASGAYKVMVTNEMTKKTSNQFTSNIVTSTNFMGGGGASSGGSSSGSSAPSATPSPSGAPQSKAGSKTGVAAIWEAIMNVF